MCGVANGGGRPRDGEDGLHLRPAVDRPHREFTKGGLAKGGLAIIL